MRELVKRFLERSCFGGMEEGKRELEQEKKMAG